jgi:hypothetical protein
MPRLAALLMACIVLSGCSIIGEERMSYMKRDWERFKGPVWSESADKLGFEKVWPSARQKEVQNEKMICMHGNSQNRVVQQDGVSDEVAYRRCPLAPYAMDGGSRMGNRPDGNGHVVN